MGPLSAIQRWVFGGMSLVLVLLALWAARIDALREQHLTTVNDVIVTVEKAGYRKVTEKNLPASVGLIVAARDTARTERDAARQLVDIQSHSIEQLEQERLAAMRQAEANQKLAREATKQRDLWIARAKSASTRTERLSAEQEVKECEQVLDSLYSSGL